jgi:secreted trypsin-like serine protease
MQSLHTQDKDFPFCGGSLIAKDLLTAAHCISEDFNSNFTVVVGECKLTESAYGDEVEIRENGIHPLYMNSSVNRDFDIALTFLSRPTTANVSLVHLNKNNSYPP